MTVRQWIL